MYIPDYWSTLDRCKNSGHFIDSRVGPVRELLNVQMQVHPLSLPRRRKMRRELGYMELAQFIIGVWDPEYISRVAPKVDMSLFGDSAIYGPRVWNNDKDQIREVVDELLQNPNSRRAIITVSEPTDFLENQPCISSFQFQIRHGFLHTTVNVRSWDLWFGAPHDLIVMSGVAQLIAHCTGCQGLALLHINAANAHIYERSINDAGGPPLRWHFEIPPEAFDTPKENLDLYRELFTKIYNDFSWTSGAPKGFTEDFPNVPKLSPMVPSRVLEEEKEEVPS